MSAGEPERDAGGRFTGRRSANDEFNARLRAEAGLGVPLPLSEPEAGSDPGSEETVRPSFDGGVPGTITGGSPEPDEPDFNEQIRRAAAALRGR